MPEPTSPRAATDVLRDLWQDAGLPPEALGHAHLTGADPVLPSSFAVGTAAQSSLGAAALAAAELGFARGGERQRVAVDLRHATLESRGYFAIDGRVPPAWEKLSGLYRCGAGAGPGWVRIHANFAHHRDGVLKLLGCPTGPATERDEVERALERWDARELEAAAADAGMVVAAARSFAEWDAHPQAAALAALPLVSIERIADAPEAPASSWAGRAAPGDGRPLAGLRVLDLTRILAGPVAGRTLAAYGADVMLVNSPKLPNIEAIADTSRGKLSVHLDLHGAGDRSALHALLRDADVFMQGYRPGGLDQLGYGPEAVARARPGVVFVSLSAYGWRGPWSARRGFDSLVQTATGFNLAEAEAAGDARPRALPLQILDYAAGYLLAFGAQAALWRRAREGGSWHVQVGLAGVGRWLRSLGRVSRGFEVEAVSFAPYLETWDSGFGKLSAPRHAAEFERTPAAWTRPSMPPGSHPPVWP